MKKITPAIMLLAILAACTQPLQEKSKLVEKEVKIIKKVMDQPDSVLRHQVYFGFKESASAAEIQRVITAFRDLQFKIDGIENFEWGVNSSPEGLDQGLTHAFTLTFHSEEARDAYLPHPAHQEFGKLLGPILDKVTVIDYWTRP